MKLIALNKPFNVLSQFRQDGSHQTLADFIFDSTLRIAGRLDLDSEGLLLLTDHGGLNQHISHPKHKQWKTYIVQVDGEIDETAIIQLQRGVMLNDGITRPAQVRKITEPDWLWQRVPPVRFRATIPTSWVEIKICEGRNRQVRRMTAHVGFPTLRLIRTAIGSIQLQDLNLDVGQQCTLNIQKYPEFSSIDFTHSSPTRSLTANKQKSMPYSKPTPKNKPNSKQRYKFQSKNCTKK